MEYSITQQEILAFAKQVYLAGFSGYSDLCDNCCNKMVEEFLLNKKTSTPHTTLTVPQTSLQALSVPSMSNMWQSIQVFSADTRYTGSDVLITGGGQSPNYQSSQEEQQER
mgnify:CR=1 FL=1